MFRIFYFRHNVLDHAEEVEGRHVLDAIEKTAGKPSDLTAEIWSEKGKVGIIGRSRGVATHHIDFVPRPPRSRFSPDGKS